MREATAMIMQTRKVRGVARAGFLGNGTGIFDWDLWLVRHTAVKPLYRLYVSRANEWKRAV
jgi:hypothetical protein